jgi:uncharacterized phage-associated protein
MLTLTANRLDVRKATEALLHVVASVPDMYRALKVMYLADKLHLGAYGRLIYGEDYYAMSWGPVPSTGYDILKAQRPRGASPQVEWARSQFVAGGGHARRPARVPDLDYLSESDLRCLDEAISTYGGLTFNQLKELTHDEAYNTVCPTGSCPPRSSTQMPLETIATALPNAQQLLLHLRDG